MEPDPESAEPLSFDDLFTSIARFKAQFGDAPPEPLRVSDRFRWRLKIAAAKMRMWPTSESKETLFGLQYVVDDRIPEDELRMFYESTDGELHLLSVMNL